MISLIVAAANNGVIGKSGGLPWYLPAELARFKQTTMGHPIIMGRKTHESIGRALPGRTNIVISRDRRYQAEGCQTAGSLDEALARAEKAAGGEEVFVIGGQSVFEEALPKADRLYLTRIDADIEGDVYFTFNQSGWHQTLSEKHARDDADNYDFEFTVWERKN